MSGAHHVYANDLEIASRSSDGKSTAMGDVCFTPPAPAKVGVPVPYSNTARAKDIRNGSRTVFIVGKEIALSDKSYFHTSTGNEPATSQYQQGIVSQVITGRAYFHTWSPNVKVEGEGVARHTDLVSHNHNNPANTALFPFISRPRFLRHDCRREEKRIETACSEKAGRNQKRKTSGKSRGSSNNKWHWTDDFCSGLKIATNTSDKDALRAEIDEMLDMGTELISELASGALSSLADSALQGAGKLAARSAVRTVATTKGGAIAGAVVGTPTGPGAAVTTGGGATLGAVTGAVISVGDALFTLARIPAALDKARLATMLNDQATRLFDGLAGLLDDNGKFIGSDQDLSRVAGDLQDLLATLNPCLRARKCNLVPHSTKGAGWRNDKDNTSSRERGTSNVETAGRRDPGSGGGCCPGQEGHHLIPKAVMDGAKCNGYKDGDAPTVCVEGGRTSGGSHKRVHDKFDKALEKKKKAGRISGATMSMVDAIDAAVESHAEAFPASGCRDNCIRAQLEDYYKRLCPDARVNARTQEGNDIGEDNDF